MGRTPGGPPRLGAGALLTYHHGFLGAKDPTFCFRDSRTFRAVDKGGTTWGSSDGGLVSLEAQAALTEVPGRPANGGRDPCAGAASLKGENNRQALDGLTRGSDASQHRLPSLRVIPVPHISSSLLVSAYRAPPRWRPCLASPVLQW